jgi:hypothetical protein
MVVTGKQAVTRHHDLDLGAHHLDDLSVVLLPKQDGEPNEQGLTFDRRAHNRGDRLVMVAMVS